MAVQRSADGDTTTIATYAYDGKNRRVEKVIDNCGPEESPGDGGDTTVHFYYSDKWQILETRNGSNQAARQWVWGTQYVDELVLMDVNGSPDSDNDCDPDTGGLEAATDRRYFYHQDRNWNVVAVSMYDDGEGTDAQIIERYAYTPYGEFVVLSGAPTTSTYERGQVRLHSAIGNPFAHQGLPFDAEKLSYQNRWREYVVRLQRFNAPDPLALQSLHVDASHLASVLELARPLLVANLHQYAESTPLRFSDPSGLTPGAGYSGCGGCPVGTPPAGAPANGSPCAGGWTIFWQASGTKACGLCCGSTQACGHFIRCEPTSNGWRWNDETWVGLCSGWW